MRSWPWQQRSRRNAYDFSPTRPQEPRLAFLFFNECLELQTQRVLVQCTITIEAAICSIAALHSLSAVDADGNPLTLDQVVELIPPVPTEPAAISKGLADNVRELKR